MGSIMDQSKIMNVEDGFDTYTGEVAKRMRRGTGKMTFANGDVWEGHFSNNCTLQTSLVIRLEINIFGTNVWSSISRRPSSHWAFFLVSLDFPALWLSSPHLGFLFSIDGFCAFWPAPICIVAPHNKEQQKICKRRSECKGLRNGVGCIIWTNKVI